MPPIGYLLIAILVVIFGIIVIRTWLFTRAAADNKLAFTSSLASFKADASSAAEHLASLIRFETISHEDPKENDAKIFKEQHKQLEKLYPKTHKALTKEVLDGFSLLYTWVGTDPSLDPIALMAHQDVVPADPNTMDKWTYPPFSGKIADGYIWGRGTLDIKSQMAAVFEAVEALITNNFQPERSVMLAFGHDEEVLGTGAKSIVTHLQAKGIRLQAVLDEGGCIYDGVIPGITGYTATIGVAEKGYLSMKFTAKASGGHSSTPPHETAIGILARAIDRLQSNPFPHKVRAVRPLFQGLSPSASLIMKVAFANLWLFGGMVKRQLASSTETDATIRTTTAPTIFHSGVKDNVLPGLAEAVVNFRVLPGETIAEVNDRIRNVINDDRVAFEPIHNLAWEASPVSPHDVPAYKHIASVASELFPGAVAAPYIMLGGTDARNYYAISDQVYRFSPYLMRKENLDSVHGINEKLSVEGIGIMVEFFHRLIQRWASRDM